MNVLSEAVESWARALPPEAVKVTHPAIPEDDDYGLEMIVAFEPVRPDTCLLEVGITEVTPGQAPAAYVFLDRWAAIALRTGLRVAAGARAWVGLFLEPVTMPAERLCKICSAVARGAVELEVGAFNGRLAWTAGSVQLEDGLLGMRGPRTRPPLAGLLARAGVLRRIRVQYKAWT